MTNEQSVSNNDLLKELLSTVKDLQTEVAVLKNGATGDSSSHPPMATLSQNDSAVHGKDPPVKRVRSEEGEISEKDPPSSDEDNDDTFTLTEAGSAFMEAAFKTKLNAASRKKKMAKLGTPDCRWTKSPELESLIASTIPQGSCSQ